MSTEPIIDFASGINRTQTVRKCSNCKKPGHTKPHCKRCDYCAEEHPGIDCQNPDYMNTFSELMLVAAYSHIYHGNALFINKYSNLCGNLLHIPHIPLSQQPIRYRKTIEQFICVKLGLNPNDETDDIPMRRATALYALATSVSSQELIQTLDQESYRIINLCLKQFYQVTMSYSTDGLISYIQAPLVSITEPPLPNHDAENQIRQQEMGTRMFEHTQEFVHTVRHNIRYTAGAIYESRMRMSLQESNARRRQEMVNRIERLQSQLTHLDTSIAHNATSLTHWNERHTERQQNETRNRAILASSQQRLQQFQVSNGLPVNVPQLQQSPRPAPRRVYTNIRADFVAAAQESAVSECPICWDDNVPSDQSVVPTCAHSVCFTCLMKYFDNIQQRQTPCCSMCRAPFSKFTFHSAENCREFADKYLPAIENVVIPL